MTDVTSETLDRLRDALAGDTPASDAAPSDPLELLQARARAAGIRVEVVPPGGDHDSVVGEIIAGAAVESIAVSTDPAAREACLYHGAAAVSGPASDADVAGCGAGVLCVDAAAADVGALVLEGGDDPHHRLQCLAPPLVVALLPRDRIVATLAEAATADATYVTARVGASAGADDIRVVPELHVVVHG